MYEIIIDGDTGNWKNFYRCMPKAEAMEFLKQFPNRELVYEDRGLTLTYSIGRDALLTISRLNISREGIN